MNRKHTKEENQAKQIERLRNQICLNSQSYWVDLGEKDRIIQEQNLLISELKEYNKHWIEVANRNKEIEMDLKTPYEVVKIKAPDKPVEQMNDEEINRLIEEKRNKTNKK